MLPPPLVPPAFRPPTPTHAPQTWQHGLPAEKTSGTRCSTLLLPLNSNSVTLFPGSFSNTRLEPGSERLRNLAAEHARSLRPVHLGHSAPGHLHALSQRSRTPGPGRWGARPRDCSRHFLLYGFFFFFFSNLNRDCGEGDKAVCPLWM